MGFKTLANGWEYYSITEELGIFAEEIYGFLANLAPGYYLLVFTIFMGFFILYIAIYIKAYFQQVTV